MQKSTSKNIRSATHDGLIITGDLLEANEQTQKKKEKERKLKEEEKFLNEIFWIERELRVKRSRSLREKKRRFVKLKLPQMTAQFTLNLNFINVSSH